MKTEDIKVMAGVLVGLAIMVALFYFCVIDGGRKNSSIKDEKFQKEYDLTGIQEKIDLAVEKMNMGREYHYDGKFNKVYEEK